MVMTQLLRLLGENVNELTKKQQYELDKLYNQAFKMIPRSPAQMKVRKKIKQLRKKFKMDERKSNIKKVKKKKGKKVTKKKLKKKCG